MSDKITQLMDFDKDQAVQLLLDNMDKISVGSRSRLDNMDKILVG